MSTPSDPPFSPAKPSLLADPYAQAPQSQQPQFQQPQPSAPGPAAIASLGRRAVAYLLDGLVMLVMLVPIMIVILVVAAIANGGSFHAQVSVDEDSTTTQLLTFAAVAAAFGLLPVAYLWGTTRRTGPSRGQTIGMSAMSIRIVQLSGSELSPAQARNRALALALPSTIAVVVGSLLDAVLSTPPLMTNIALVVGSLWNLVSFFVAPLLGEDRRALHDHLAGTVVVGPPADTTYAGAPAGRPKTVLTWIYGAVGALLLLAFVIAEVALLASSSSSTSNDDLQRATQSSGSSLSPSGAKTTDSLSVVQSTFSTGEGEAGAMRVANLLGRQFAECVTMVTSIDDCKTDADLGLPAGAIKIRKISEPPSGTASLSEQIVLTDGSAWGHPDDRFIGIYDEHGYLWGWIFEPTGNFGPACRNIPGKDCGDAKVNPLGHTFMNDDNAIKSISAAAGG